MDVIKQFTLSEAIAYRKIRGHESKVPSQEYFQDPAATTQNTADLTAFVQNLLQQMQSRFLTMSDSIITKNEMGNRIDDLERSIGDLVKEVGVEPAFPRPDEGQPDSTMSDSE